MQSLFVLNHDKFKARVDYMDTMLVEYAAVYCSSWS